MAITEITVSKIYVLATEPTNKVKDRFWFDTTNNLLKRYDGSSWKPISVSSDDVAVLSDGSKISLTNYLNTQIAALVEGIDSKQDKLSYYSETSGDTPSATISVANIKLTGKVAEGQSTTASGGSSHAEGTGTTASGLASHAEGWYTIASGQYSHAEGQSTTASSYGSHAEGTNTIASGQYSHAEGRSTTAKGDYQHAQGKFNIEDANDKYADIVGNGSSSSARSNAATVSWDGISWSQSDVRAGGTDQDNAIHSLNSKANDSDVVKLTGDQTISGIKEFETIRINPGYFYEPTILGYKIVNGGGLLTSTLTVGHLQNEHLQFNSEDLQVISSSNGGLITSLSISGIEGNSDLSFKTTQINPGEKGSNITISAGDTNAQDKQGGTINISAGDNTSSTVPNSGGSITLNGGTPSSAGGTAIFRGGSGTQSGGGMVIANGGNDGTGGNISIQAGGGMGGNGNIILGNANNIYFNADAIAGDLVDSTISSSSLNTHIPTSKAVYDALQTASTGLEYIKEKQGENNVDTIITTAVGDPDGANTAGNVLITTGKDQASGGKITITTAGGTSSGASSKNIDINTGNTVYNSGDVNISTGTSQFSTSGDINLTTGECEDATKLCGNINLKTGGINGNPGNINIETQNTGSITLKGGTGHLIKILEDGIILNSGNNVVDNAGLATGNQTTASGWYSHTEGFFTTASGDSSHAEGIGTTASSECQHVQGKYNIIDNNNVYANIIGNGTSDIRNNAQTVSWNGISWSQTDVRAGGTDQYSAAHSLSNKQDKLSTYSETIPTDTSYPEEVVITAKGQQFVASNGAGKITLSATDSTDSGDGFSAGTINLNASKVQQNGVDIATATDLANKQNKLLYYSETSGDTPSATISVANIKLNGRVAEGNSTTASGSFSHAEGRNTTASGDYSHAEGSSTTASGIYSRAGGFKTTASGNGSHAEGNRTTASGNGSHTEGYNTTASSDYQHAQGKYNIEDANDKYADIIGNGSDEDTRSNAATVSWDGISWSQTDVRAGGTDQDSATYSLAALSEGKQDKLVFYREEDTSTRQEALIRGADSFSILSTNKGLILDGNNGGITIKNGTIKDQDLIYIESNVFGAGRSIISIANSIWNDDAILFNIEGEVIKISDALLIPQIKNKQNSTDTALNTINKTIVGAINELRKSIIGAFDPITDVWTATTASTLTSIISDATYANTPGRILISPKITNTGAIKVGDNITDISKAFPLYPDQIVSFTFSDINNFKVAADSVNDGFNYIIEFSVISPYTSQTTE